MKALMYGLGTLIVILTICGLGNLAPTRYGESNGGQYFLFLAGICLFILIVLMIARRAKAQAAREQLAQQPPPPVQEMQERSAPPLPRQSSSGGVLFVPKISPGDPFRRAPEDEQE